MDVLSISAQTLKVAARMVLFMSPGVDALSPFTDEQMAWVDDRIAQIA